MFNGRQCTRQVTSPQAWHENAKVLYDILGQPLLPQPHESTFLTPQNVRKAIDRLQFGKAHDHDGFVGEQFIYALDILLPLLAHIFNRAMCEGFPTRWTQQTLCQSSRLETPLCLAIIEQS